MNEVKFRNSKVILLRKSEEFKKKAAFTLAEILITLGIIGVVAAITIPMLTKTYQTKVRDIQFKKMYSTLNQALLALQGDYGYIPNCY